MKIGRLFRSQHDCKDSVRRPPKAKARPIPLCVEILEDRTVPATLPGFTFPLPPLPDLGNSLSSNIQISLANFAAFQQVAVSNNFLQQTMLLSSFATSNLPSSPFATIVDTIVQLEPVVLAFPSPLLGFGLGSSTGNS